jgi:hypothetical protein
MSMLHVHISKLHVHASRSCYKCILFSHAACKSCMSILHVLLHANASCPCSMSMSPCCLSILHLSFSCPCLSAACPCCKNMLHEYENAHEHKNIKRTLKDLILHVHNACTFNEIGRFPGDSCTDMRIPLPNMLH